MSDLICPLLSIGNDTPRPCLGFDCEWWHPVCGHPSGGWCAMFNIAIEKGVMERIANEIERKREDNL